MSLDTTDNPTIRVAKRTPDFAFDAQARFKRKVDRPSSRKGSFFNHAWECRSPQAKVCNQYNSLVIHNKLSQMPTATVKYGCCDYHDIVQSVEHMIICIFITTHFDVYQMPDKHGEDRSKLRLGDMTLLRS